MAFKPGYGQGVDSTVHRTNKDGDAYCGEETTTVGDAESAADLVRNHGFQSCFRCDCAVDRIELSK
ncbi:hypothetical protein [Streptomyces anthocyanicus]|uniref:hypothetical protein n=1 Tax=Streptomyces anthocyanicus TaxID=68174 RepID=UPI00386CBD31|nr:hypothetical protein OH747_05040 [Streptomyces anthocyanicus]